MTYDDLLTRLRDTLADDEHGAAACARLRERYRVALVDEFQDTDPIQWEILRRAFGEEDATLILIGDPKQAVYSFRGADVYAYLNAARAPWPRGRWRRTGAATRGSSTRSTRSSTAPSSATKASSTDRSARRRRTVSRD